MKNDRSKRSGADDSIWVVLKFGGTCVSSLKNWETIKSVISERYKSGLRLLVVCSAIQGASDQLDGLLAEAVSGGHMEVLNEIEYRHRELADQLGINFDEVKSHFDELSKLVTGASLTGEVSPRLRAQVFAFGELLSTQLGAAYLNANGVPVQWYDARDLLTSCDEKAAGTNRRYLSAHCDYDPDNALKSRLISELKPVVITQGFIAKNRDGETVLLGRGGSDVSASYFAAKIGALRCEIWTDVPGMYTANPHKVPSAHLLTTLDYAEALEIASTGAKVLHPRCIAPVRKSGIPLHIRCLEKPDIEGTVISDDAKKTTARLKSISTKLGVTLISMETVDMWHQAGFLAEVFDCFKCHDLSVDLISSSETNVTVTLDQIANALDQTTIDALVNALQNFCRVRVIHSCALLSLVGRDIRSILHQLGPALEVFEAQKVYLVSQAANDLNLTFVVDEDQVERLARRLHSELFKQRGHDTLLGPTWHDLFEKGEAKEAPRRTDWWLERRDVLLGLAKEKSPLYVYDEKTIEKAISGLKKIKTVDRIFYSIKANPYPEILRKIYEAGLNFECVSKGELQHILELFPKIDPKRILFTPNFASREEYEFAYKAEVLVTLDNLFPIQTWQALFRSREIFVRMDPGHGQGHHRYAKTAGEKTKFGISFAEIDSLIELTKKCDTRVVGIHAHVGSNIFTPDTWSQTAHSLASVAETFSDCSVLDLGGGLGVVETPGKESLDLAQVDKSLKGFKSKNPRYELWIEPGRFIVAEAGVLLTRVTQTKQKGDYYYVGVNTGMNTLIRPALYGSYHEIVNLSRLDQEDHVTANIVGPICETGDILGYERNIARPEEGDVILIATTGAYGRVMSSNYNLRPPAEEYFLC